MEEKFAIRNFRNPVSLEQFQENAFTIYKNLEAQGEIFNHSLYLTTDMEDYDTLGSTIVTPETEAASKRVKICDLFTLTQELWEKSYKKTYFIKEDVEKLGTGYGIWVSHERSQPRQIIVNGSNLNYAASKAIMKTKRENKFRIRTPKEDRYSMGTLASF